MDTLVFSSEPLEAARKGVYVKGLYLLNASMDVVRGYLKPSRFQELYSHIACVQLLPTIIKTEADSVSPSASPSQSRSASPAMTRTKKSSKTTSTLRADKNEFGGYVAPVYVYKPCRMNYMSHLESHHSIMTPQVDIWQSIRRQMIGMSHPERERELLAMEPCAPDALIKIGNSEDVVRKEAFERVVHKTKVEELDLISECLQVTTMRFAINEEEDREEWIKKGVCVVLEP